MNFHQSYLRKTLYLLKFSAHSAPKIWSFIPKNLDFFGVAPPLLGGGLPPKHSDLHHRENFWPQFLPVPIFLEGSNAIHLKNFGRKVRKNTLSSNIKIYEIASKFLIFWFIYFTLSFRKIGIELKHIFQVTNGILKKKLPNGELNSQTTF